MRSLLNKLEFLHKKGLNYMKLSNTKIRAYARTVSAGLRTMNEVDEAYKVSVYIELMARYNWTLEDVEEKYLDDVKKELGMK